MKESCGSAENEKEGWARFEQAVDAAIKSGPKHRPAKEKITKPSSGASSSERKRERRL